MRCGPFDKARCEEVQDVRAPARQNNWGTQRVDPQLLREELQGIREMLVSDFKSVVGELERQQRELFQQQEAILRTIVAPPQDVDEASSKWRQADASNANFSGAPIEVADANHARCNGMAMVTDSQLVGHQMSGKPFDYNFSGSARLSQSGHKANGVQRPPWTKKSQETQDGLKASLNKKKSNNMFGESSSKGDLSEMEYDVAVYYHDTGVCQEIARNENFANITLLVIATNAVYMGVSADHNKAENLAETALPFIIFDNVYCIYFAAEWLVRFCAFRSKLDCFKDAWFQFDTAVCVTMVLETWIMASIESIYGSSGGRLPTAPIRLLRLLRLARMVRLMRYFPEVMTMVKGVKKAFRAMGSALLLLICLVYMFAMIMHMIMKGQEDVALHWERLPDCMLTLLLDGTLLDGIGYRVREFLDLHSFIGFTIFMLFVLVSALTVMNMLIGVLCEVVSRVAAKEKEDADIRIMKSSILTLLQRLDSDGDGLLNSEELEEMLADEDAVVVLRELGVDTEYMMNYTHMLFETHDGLSVAHIMEIILAQRADRETKVKDLVDMQFFLRWTFAQTLRRIWTEEMRGEAIGLA